MQATYNPEISDLRERAVAVLRVDALATRLSARQAARGLSGIVNLVVQRCGISAMQQACADLVRFEPAWASRLGFLPHDGTGYVAEGVQLIAIVARGLLELAGPANLRDALAFWASESDPAMWTSVTEG